MRWLFASAVVLVLPLGSGALEAPVLFRDDFLAPLDPEVWRVSSGRGPGSCTGQPCWDPAHATVADGVLRLRLDAVQRSGAEIRTHTPYQWGSYEVRMKAPAGAGGLLAFFTYACPPGEEIDFVELRTGSAEFWTTVWQGADCETMQDQATTTLRFDPSEDFHIYRFERLPGRVVISVDGFVRGEVDHGVGDAAQPLFLSLWQPKWIKPGPAEDLVAEIDWVQMVGAQG